MESSNLGDLPTQNTQDPHTLFKSLEKDYRTYLPEKSLVGIRLDGKAFGKFTKQFKVPYDFGFMDAMDSTAKFIMQELIAGALFAYVQSDEITIFFTDLKNKKGGHIFGGKVEKIVSTSASTASVGFMKAMPDCLGSPVFDARVFVLEDYDQLQEYVDWRRLDARKNAISMAVETLKSHSELRGVKTSERRELLRGTEYEELPSTFLYGRIIRKEYYEDTVTFTHGSTGKILTQQATRSRWVVVPAVREIAIEVVNSVR